jgi:integrase
MAVVHNIFLSTHPTGETIMIVKLTPEFIADNLQCPAGKRRVEYVDKGGTGLYVEVRATSPGQGTYYLRYKDASGKTRHVKIGRTTDIDLDEARRRAKQLKAEITLGKNPRQEANNKKAIPTLTAFMEEQYIPYQHERIRGWERQSDLFKNHLQPTFGNQPLDQISLNSVQQFLTLLRNKGYAASTCNHPVRVLRHAISLACKWGILEKDHLIGLSLLREDNHVNNILTDDELKRLVKVLKSDRNKMVSAVCLFLLSTGCRLNEALNSRWEHFDLEHKNWTIPSEHSKSRKIRSIPLNPTAIQILESLGTQDKYDHPFIGRRGKLTTINRVWDRLRNDAGLPHLRLHDLRHNYASFLINSGRSLYDVQKILGHSDPTVTQRYAHLSTKSLQDAASSASDIINAAMSD